MKNKIILTLAIILFLITPVYASPTLNSITISPQNPWIYPNGTVDNVHLRVECSESNTNLTISKVVGNVTGPGIIIPSFELTKTGNNTFEKLLDGSYFVNNGSYTATFVCANNASENTTQTKTFQVSKIDGKITSYPSKVYVNDEISIYFDVKKDGQSVINDTINFTVYLDNKKQSLGIPPFYEISKGWVLRFPAPSKSGSYNIKVKAKYQRAIIEDEVTINVEDKLKMELTSINKTEFYGGEVVSTKLIAYWKGEPIKIQKEDLTLTLEDSLIEIKNISYDGYQTIVTFVMPEMKPGIYNLAFLLTYNGEKAQVFRQITYPAKIVGSIKEIGGNAISTRIIFSSRNMQKTFSTDNKGNYNIEIIPGVYDVEFQFGNFAKLKLFDANITSSNDIIKFSRIKNIKLEGISVTSAYAFETTLSYKYATIEMLYDATKILNESSIEVFKCDSWNFAAQKCLTNFKKVGAEIDKVRDIVKINTTSLSAFAIGKRKNLKLDVSATKKEYILFEPIKISGIVLDEDNNRISGAKITAKLGNITAYTTSDNKGIFEINLEGMKKEGNYSISVEASKKPFIPTKTSFEIKVIRTKELAISASSAKVMQGENVTSSIIIANTGQTTLTNAKISLTGIPKEYYSFNKSYIPILEPNQKEDIEINFSIPKNANVTTYVGTLLVKTDQLEKNATLTLTILEKEEENKWPTFSLPNLPTGLFALPISFTDFAYLISISFVSFSVTFFMKRRKNTKKKQTNIMGYFEEIKKSITGTKAKKSENLKFLDLVIKKLEERKK